MKYGKVELLSLQKLLEEQTELNRTSWTIYKAVVGDIKTINPVGGVGGGGTGYRD